MAKKGKKRVRTHSEPPFFVLSSEPVERKIRNADGD
jgi:hypothetical protein